MRTKLAPIALLLSMLACIAIIGIYASCRAVDIASGIIVTEYDPYVDYMELMRMAAEDGSEHALIAGAVYEKQRNLKIAECSLPYPQTSYFTDYETGADILWAIQRDVPYTQEDLDWLSRVIYAEMGCEWIPDEIQLKVGSVVLNRVRSTDFPDTIYDVIHQKGQYSCVSNGSIWKTPDERTIRNAKRLLEEGSILPAGVIGQSSVPFGTVYDSYYDSILGTTTYFFYGEWIPS